MNPTNNPEPPATDAAASGPLASPEEFAAYQEAIRERLQARQAARARAARRQFLEDAVADTNALREDALALQDDETVAELDVVLQNARRELRSLLAEAPDAAPPAPADVTNATDAAEEAAPPAVSDPAPAAVPCAPAPAPPPVRLERERPLADVERDALACQAELITLLETRPLQRADGSLDVAACLRLRALACRERALRVQAGDVRPHEEVAALDALFYALAEERERAGDQDDAPPFTARLTDLTSLQWATLAREYLLLADGWEACEWLETHRAHLTPDEIKAILHAAACVQALFFRTQNGMNVREPYQNELREYVFDLVDGTYFEPALGRGPLTLELRRDAATLADALEAARPSVARHETAQAKVRRREDAIADLEKLVERPGFGQGDAGARAADRDALRAAVRACQEAGVPPSNKAARTALLPWAGALLGDEPEFARIVQEVEKERKRRSLSDDIAAAAAAATTTAPAPEDDEPEADAPPEEQELQAVLKVTRGKKALLLGGTPRQPARARIQEALEFSALEWPEARDGDSRWSAEIGRADLTLVLIGFATHKVSGKAQEVGKQKGKTIVLVPHGYGVSQIVRALFEQVTPEGHAATAPAPPDAEVTK